MALLTARSGRRGRRAWLRAAALAALGWAAAAAAGPTAAQEASLEYAVKANYLYKLGPFVEWPPGAFAGPASPFNVCVFGQDPFGQLLDQAVRGQTVGGRAVAILRLQSISGAPPCHVLYLGRSQGQSPDEALKAVRGAPVLTVTDERQGSVGGVVHFLLKGGRVRFALDAGAARVNGLLISSKLLGLAVTPQGGAG